MTLWWGSSSKVRKPTLGVSGGSRQVLFSGLGSAPAFPGLRKDCPLRTRLMATTNTSDSRA